MRRTQMLVLVILGLFGALLVAGCGDDDDSGSEEDQDEITAVIERSATGGDPAACVDTQTQAFTEQTTGETGQKAIESCERDIEDQADAVEVSEIEVDGDAATANVAFEGSFFDGQTIAVGLIKEGEAWKLNAANEFVGGFDREAFTTAFEAELAAAEDIPPGVSDCIQENILALSEEEIDQLFLESDSELESQVFEACFEQ
jgi:copper chaperone CopZ